MDNKIDYSRVAKIISAVHPDIVAVQELDSATARSGNTDVLKEVANQCGYHYYFGPAISYDGGKYGVGVLTKEKPLNVTMSLYLVKRKNAILKWLNLKTFIFSLFICR
jgi:endonuclease/exonuclease/phosphatase family metal-dependent hydrolase